MKQICVLVVASAFFVACGGTVTEGTGGGGPGGGGSTSTTVSTSSSNACNCDAYFGVCGVDGQTYNAACGDECVPVEIACRNECPCSSCDELREQYLAALEQARACNPLIDFNECTLLVDEVPDCPCAGIYVNPSNSQAIVDMNALKQKYQDTCGPIACPPIACEPPTAGFCNGFGATGLCDNQF